MHSFSVIFNQGAMSGICFVTIETIIRVWLVFGEENATQLDVSRPIHNMRLRLRFTFIFAAKIPHHSIDNNVNIFVQTQTQKHSVNGP